MYTSHDVFIDNSSRLCAVHVARSEIKSISSLAQIRRRMAFIPVEEMKLMVSNAASTTNHSCVSFSDKSLNNEDYNGMTGISKEDFDDLLSHLQLRDRGGISPRDSLGMFLMKLRVGSSHRELATLFRVSLKSVHNRIKGLRVMFDKLEGFVDQNLGASSMTRDDIINKHTTVLAKELFGANKLILIEDATYIYIQKSFDYAHARRTYCLYKKRHLVKPMVCVTTTGRYVDIYGPYFSNSKNSDAHIFTHQMSVDARTETDGLRKLLRPGDLWVVDRGFKGAQFGDSETEMKMPSFKPKSQKQHNTFDANESRRVTKIRWVVEAANSRLKQFKFLSRVVSNSQLQHIRSYCRIVAALCNKYRPPIATDRQHHQHMAQEMKAKMTANNSLKEYCCKGGIYESDAAKNWEKVDSSYVKHFPMLTELEIEQHIAFGCYQIEQAENYIHEHFSTHGDFQLFKSKIPPKRDNLLHVKFKSRHTEASKYDVYVELDNTKPTPWQKIHAWYCTCASGARTVGCCAHVASVIWWLGIGRLKNQRMRRSSNWLSVVHAAEELNRCDIVCPLDQEDESLEVDSEEASSIGDLEELDQGKTEPSGDEVQGMDNGGKKVAFTRHHKPRPKPKTFTQPGTLTVEIGEPSRQPPKFLQSQCGQSPSQSSSIAGVMMDLSGVTDSDSDIIVPPPSLLQSKFINLASRIAIRTTTEQYLQRRELSQSELVDADAIITLLVDAIEQGEQSTSLGQVNNITLSPASVGRLIPAVATHDMWLDSDVINSYISILEKRMIEDVWLFNSFFYEYVVLEHQDDCTRRQWKRCEQANKNTIMIPINETGIHWSVLIINQARREMGVYGGSNDFANTFVTHMRRVEGSKRLRSNAKTISLLDEIEAFEKVTNIGMPKIQQQDGFNCGVIMLLHMELIGIGNRHRQTFAASHLEQYRLFILLQLCKEIWDCKK
jgi:hypothetical protein